MIWAKENKDTTLWILQHLLHSIIASKSLFTASCWGSLTVNIIIPIHSKYFCFIISKISLKSTIKGIFCIEMSGNHEDELLLCNPHLFVRPLIDNCNAPIFAGTHWKARSFRTRTIFHLKSEHSITSCIWIHISEVNSSPVIVFCISKYHNMIIWVGCHHRKHTSCWLFSLFSNNCWLRWVWGVNQT